MYSTSVCCFGPHSPYSSTFRWKKFKTLTSLFPISPFPAGTLADLKRTRSQNRVAGSTASSLNTSNNSLASQNELDGVAMNPGQGSLPASISSTSSPSSRRDPGVTLDPRAVSSREHRSRGQGHQQHPSASPNSRKKFAASSIEVVGPPLKTGCCSII